MAIVAGMAEVPLDGNEHMITVAAAGEYDPEKQLSDEQIIELKKKLRVEDEYLRGLLMARVCARIAYELELSDIDYSAIPTTKEQLQDEVEGVALNVARRAAQWALGLSQLVELPGAEWDRNSSPPATYAEALRKVETQLAEGGNI